MAVLIFLDLCMICMQDTFDWMNEHSFREPSSGLNNVISISL